MSEMKKWKLTSAFVTGLSHQREGTPCQDKIAVTPAGSGRPYHGAALADGVGSLKNSHIAATLATDTALTWMEENRHLLFAEGYSEEEKPQRCQDLAAQMVERIRTVIRERAESRGMDPGTMDCNLAFCFIDEERGEAFVGQLGDCAVCIVADDGDKRRSRVMNEQGMLANSTDTVLSRGSEKRVNVVILPLKSRSSGKQVDNSVYGIILTSDGLENVLYRKGSDRVGKQAEYCFNLDADTDEMRAERLRELLMDAQDNSRGYLNDDMSVVVFSRATGKITLPDDPYWICKECGARNIISERQCHSCGEKMLSMYPETDIKKAGGVENYFEALNKQEKTDAKVPEDPPKTGRTGKKSARKNTKPLKVVDNGTGQTDVPPAGPRNVGSLNKKLDQFGEGHTHEETKEDEGYKGDPPVDEGPRMSLGTWGLLIVMAAAFIALVAILIVSGVRAMLPDGTTRSTEPGGQVIQTTPPTGQGSQGGITTPQVPSGEGIALEDGSIYFGELDEDAKPHGYGTRILGDTVWTGCFVRGRMNGTFTITDLKDREVSPCVVFYENDVITKVYYGDAKVEGEDIGIVKHKGTLYESTEDNAQPVRDSEGNVVRLRKDERVYLNGLEEEDENGIKWCWVRTEAGIEGWYEDGNIIRTIPEETLPEGTMPGTGWGNEDIP